MYKSSRVCWGYGSIIAIYPFSLLLDHFIWSTDLKFWRLWNDNPNFSWPKIAKTMGALYKCIFSSWHLGLTWEIPSSIHPEAIYRVTHMYCYANLLLSVSFGVLIFQIFKWKLNFRGIEHLLSYCIFATSVTNDFQYFRH